jgi:CheY-like chemotaxis protein
MPMLLRLIGEDIAVQWQPMTPLWPVKIDPGQVDQILVNLCANARDAIAGVGGITIETGQVSITTVSRETRAGLVPGDYVSLTVVDDGPGMDTQTLSHLFEPFFTTKSLGMGTGLGLATVHGIIRQNGGIIDVSSTPGHGTKFRILLPRDEGGTQCAGSQGVATVAQGGHETILLVEDEPHILSLTATMLQRLGYHVLAAGTPREAIAMAAEFAGRIRLLLTDVVMPEMNGRDLAQALLARHPQLKCLFMSGYTAEVIAQNGVLDDGTQFLQKPFSLVELATRARQALDGVNAPLP